ncbi:MAG: glycoside hydrolase family 3 C-terminal domain-containing protein [Cyclobacteriaceae bacterium]|nr:glycoside hydrolase family 3 C-terminal domain-containing protein [Cyclobacteriaceae bacterium HetDA_MAG_MS6]
MPHGKSDHVHQKVDSLLALMTLKEKLGQLNHLKGNYSTDIYEQNVDLNKAIADGEVGALTPFTTMDNLIRWQKIATEESRLGIPLFYAADVVHGYKTIFPVPIGQAASWDMEAIELSERIAATEMASAGLNWTFAPMLDVTRDPRWGRVMEGPGEDPFLAGEIAKARVRGFQGDDLGAENTVLACAKHFVAYGAPEGGRDYNTVEVSQRTLREVYLPPFQEAVEEGVATVMNGFNTLNSIPASANSFLLRDILKGEWGFAGFTVSDANSFYELIPHGVAADRREAALKCIQAGSDTDLWSQVYIDHLEQLVSSGAVDPKLVDDAVRRVLKYKYELGLFEDPFRYLDSARMTKTLMQPAFLEAARDLARKSLVLLKNEQKLLPLDNQSRKIALIGPLAHSRQYRDLMGNWKAAGDMNDVVTIYEGLVKRVGKENVYLAQGCEAFGKCPTELTNQASAIARKADIVILAIGENGYSTGEGASKTNLSLPGNQEDLVEAISKTGKPVIALLFNGRPLIFHDLKRKVPAVLECWEPGTTAGDAVMDVVFGDYNPSGKLPITFPNDVGQIPIYHSQLNTGRPRSGPDDKRWGVSKWSDVPNEPLYPFGYGLSYTNFTYSKMQLSDSVISKADTLLVSVDTTNAGDYSGCEVVQLYIQDPVASVSRPVKALKAFDRVCLEKGKRQKVVFHISVDDLKYWDDKMNYKTDGGIFHVFVGSSSVDVSKMTFRLEDLQ